MFIKEIYISSFGKIENKKIVFNDLTSFCENNGYGKTTICSFIKAMFYGLKQIKANTKTFEDRIHFFPFEKDYCGGSLTYIKNSDEIRIERSFGKKTNDTLVVYKNNVRVDNPQNYIGESLFGIDEEGFIRTIFTDANAIETGTNLSISDKLSQTVEVVSLDSIYHKLDVKEKEINKEIKSLDETCADYKDRITDYSKIELFLTSLYEKYNSLTSKGKYLSNLINEGNKINQQLDNYKEYLRMVDQIEVEKQKAAEVKSKYNKGFLTEEEILKIRTCAKEIDKLNAENNANVLQANEKTDYQNLLSLFGKEVEKQEFHRIQAIIQTLEKNIHLNELLDSNYVKDDNEVFELFNNNELSLDNINYLQMKKEDYQKTTDNIKRIQGKLSQKKNTKAYAIILLVLGILAICGGITSIIFRVLDKIFFGYILLLLASVLFVLTFLLFNKHKKETSKTELILEKEKQNNIVKEVALFIRKYRITESKGIIEDIDLLLKLWDRYNGVKDKINNDNSRKAKNNQEIEKSRKELDRFFNIYHLSGKNYQEMYTLLYMNNEKYKELIVKDETLKNKRSELTMQIENYKNIITNILSIYDIEETDYLPLLDEIIKDKNEYDTIYKQIERLTSEKERYVLEKNVIVNNNISYVDIDDLEEQRSVIIKEIARIDQEIKEREQQVEALEEMTKTYDNYISEKNNLLRKKSIITKTKEIFKDAETSLKEKYIEPVKNSFSEYFDKVSYLKDNIMMDSDYRVKIVKNGVLTDEKHLSSGEHAILSLCFRLALIDNIYKVESPFIILDDPLMSLDDQNFEKAKGLIKFISQKMQVIYFTCHKSREI